MKLLSIANASWRPTLAWVCVTAIAIQYVVRPFMASILPLDLASLIGLVLGAGGLVVQRSMDKRAGVA